MQIRTTRTIAFAGLVFLAAGRVDAASTPPDAPMIGEAYYKCEQPRLLEGGIYGKGPFHRFGPSGSKRDCARWTRVSKDAFRSLATQWFAHDWSTDLPFWREP
jgi:hypothetical protein